MDDEKKYTEQEMDTAFQEGLCFGILVSIVIATVLYFANT